MRSSVGACAPALPLSHRCVDIALPGHACTATSGTPCLPLSALSAACWPSAPASTPLPTCAPPSCHARCALRCRGVCKGAASCPGVRGQPRNPFSRRLACTHACMAAALPSPHTVRPDQLGIALLITVVDPRPCMFCMLEQACVRACTRWLQLADSSPLKRELVEGVDILIVRELVSHAHGWSRGPRGVCLPAGSHQQ